MQITIDLAVDERIALRRLASEQGIDGLELAAKVAIREFLISIGMLEPEHQIDEDTETVGEA